MEKYFSLTKYYKIISTLLFGVHLVLWFLAETKEVDFFRIRYIIFVSFVLFTIVVTILEKVRFRKYLKKSNFELWKMLYKGGITVNQNNWRKFLSESLVEGDDVAILLSRIYRKQRNYEVANLIILIIMIFVVN